MADSMYSLNIQEFESGCHDCEFGLKALSRAASSREDWKRISRFVSEGWASLDECRELVPVELVEAVLSQLDHRVSERAHGCLRDYPEIAADQRNLPVLDVYRKYGGQALWRVLDCGAWDSASTAPRRQAF